MCLFSEVANIIFTCYLGLSMLLNNQGAGSRNGSCTMKCLAIVLCIGVKLFYFTNVTEIKYCFWGFVLNSSVI